MPRASLNGVRMHVILTKRQDKLLRILSRQTGLTVAELIRRGLDLYLAGSK